MDSATFHKLDETKCIIVEAVGATLLYVPACSLDINSIEQDFAAIRKIWSFNNKRILLMKALKTISDYLACYKT